VYAEKDIYDKTTGYPIKSLEQHTKYSRYKQVTKRLGCIQEQARRSDLPATAVL